MNSRIMKHRISLLEARLQSDLYDLAMWQAGYEIDRSDRSRRLENILRNLLTVMTEARYYRRILVSVRSRSSLVLSFWLWLARRDRGI